MLRAADSIVQLLRHPPAELVLRKVDDAVSQYKDSVSGVSRCTRPAKSADSVATTCPPSQIGIVLGLVTLLPPTRIPDLPTTSFVWSSPT